MAERVVVVVGGSSGIGLASAERFGAEGDRVVLAARSDESLQRAADMVREAGAADVQTVALDVRDAAAVDRLIETTVSRYGRIDALVHTATVMAYGRLEELSDEVFDTVVDTAIHGTANIARSVVPLFRRQHHGTVVVVNSLLGAVTVPLMGAYATAKWGQRAILRTLQQELRGERDVHVCIVSPGGTNTPIYYQGASLVGREARPPIPVLQPTHTAEVIAELLRHPRRHVSTRVGPTNALIVFGYRMLPLVYDAIIGPFFRLGGLTGRSLEPTAGNVTKPRPEAEAVHGRWPAGPD